jgi:beta-lactamase regulating signal transducer with metallopeptidase domain
MAVLVAIALKSLLIAAIALGLLQLMRGRSAAERSWVAHIGLLALVLLAVAPLVLPTWSVEAPLVMGEVAHGDVKAPAADVQPAAAAASAKPIAPAGSDIVANAPATKSSLSTTAAAVVLYAVPAAILLLVMLLAVMRLIALRARADVLVDGHWLSALARAQQRMGFKHGTALLTSDDLASPISWGLMRPVILLNSRAVEAAGEAEAIIAHELAHVARMDWIKLLLARFATALFWFNPLVWLLAREAHQLREEAADDAVLAANIADTDYAQLLVGVARHECPGLLLGAHGVAPSKSSLARRVARVLDVKSVRGPVARSFAFGVLAGAFLVAAPLAALTLTPGGTASRDTDAVASPLPPYYVGSPEVPKDIPSLIADGVTTAVAAVAPVKAPSKTEFRAAEIAQAVESATRARDSALAQAGQAVAQASQAVAQAQVIARAHAGDDSNDDIIEMRAAGVTAQYVKAMRAAAPSLRSLSPAEFAGMYKMGVTPQFARDLGAAGFRHLDEDDLTSAKAIGMTGSYARGMAAAGVRPDMDGYIQLKAVGVPVEYVRSLHKAGRNVRDADELVQMWAVGVRPGDVRLRGVVPPTPPGVPPPGWDPTDPDPDDG